ncbi:replicative DNA helicase [Nostoc parmelioides]|uniref:Replicative DNA helicase n=1 Tax=Nostoc parmelioides FACHB-3921 TaxID=2692909 RepID=A0ABR8BMU8_9NOSO|nr:replicative DNA helicase [Nostoc parmelioides]MBD2255258.1 replicative DNA helicase [Nostoc parmelioides FACHB-3921]
MYASDDNVIPFGTTASKLPPQSIESEEAILGGILLDPVAIERVRDILKPHHFYISAHGRIYSTALKLNALELPTDLLMVTNYLTDNGLLEIIGGRNKLASLVDSTVSAVNIDALATVVVSKWKRRELGRLGNLAIELQHKSDEEAPLEQAFEQLQDFIYQLQRSSNTTGANHISDVVVNLYQEIEDRSQGKVLPGIPTGFYDLDAITGGFNRTDLIIVAGRPAMGKSAFAAQIAFYLASAYRYPVVVFSLEMSKLQIAMRALSSEANIDSGYLKSGRISDTQWQSLSQGIGTLSELPVYLDDRPDPPLTYIEAECRKIMARERRDLGLIVVDYLQLMDGNGGGNRNNEIEKLTRGLKRLAMKLQTPVLCLSQLSRAVESRNNKRPMLSDLRDSGGIEQDGDKVIMLYRDEYYEPSTVDRGVAEIILAKNRDGATGTIKLLFDAHFTKFKNMVRAQPERSEWD